ncbi:MAG TPA: hypothetical protein VL137_07275 [Polyangiaceae bacterium]|nr:hypothetical protein [Polyangiaceae bacterium]
MKPAPVCSVLVVGLLVGCTLLGALCGCTGPHKANRDAGAAGDNSQENVPFFPTDPGAPVAEFACDASRAAWVQAPEAGVNAADGSACVVHNPAVSYRRDVAPVLRGCTGELCHVPWSYPAIVDVTASECCDGRKIIAPGDPGHSYLLQKIRGVDLCGNSSKMANISAATARTIEDWICQGAAMN